MCLSACCCGWLYSSSSLRGQGESVIYTLIMPAPSNTPPDSCTILDVSSSFFFWLYLSLSLPLSHCSHLSASITSIFWARCWYLLSSWLQSRAAAVLLWSVQVNVEKAHSRSPATLLLSSFGYLIRMCQLASPSTTDFFLIFLKVKIKVKVKVFQRKIQEGSGGGEPWQHYSATSHGELWARCFISVRLPAAHCDPL